MDCPVCKNAMITLELDAVEIDYCTECGGIWLDAGELELLLGEPGRARRLIDSLQVDNGKSERARTCPICDGKMQKIIVGSGAPVLLIDKCRKGDGLWFDKGELHEILHRAELDEDSKIQKLLKDVFVQDSD